MGNSDRSKDKDFELEGFMKFVLSRLKVDELNEVKDFVDNLIQEKDPKRRFDIPVSIFSKGLNVVEALTKYLKENLDLSYSEIAEMLGKQENTVWLNYDRANKKQSKVLTVERGGIRIPLQNLISQKRSLLESIVIYLREEERLQNKEVSDLLDTSEVVTSSAYSRGRKK